ncbi:threonine/serine dehydratase [Eubacteriales bacterium OttesenSCG-928-A19]|nr:threonine/serine dehydratase [Eubacteriales bacterium OttesenSCG-928-A19]
MGLAITLDDIRQASERIAPYVYRTPLLRAEKLDAVLGCTAYLKPECLQRTGSFKIRGATNKILTMTDEERARGIIASSSGNHAQGVAFAARMLGIKATIVLPTNAPQVKVDGTRALGAEVVQHGYGSIERYKKLYEIVDEKGYAVVHSYNDPMLMAGQGTVGYEIMQDIADADTVIVPLGGGGLMAGVAVAVKETNPRARVIGAEPAAIPRYSASRAAGEPVEVEMKPTVADGLMISVTGSNTYPIIEKYVDELVTVEDDDIIRAIREIVFGGKVLVEPSAAIGVAAVLSGGVKVRPEEKVVFVLSGGNVDPGVFKTFLQ